jgi:hypothetical protein
MQLEKLKKKMLKTLYIEKNRLENQINKVSTFIDALNGNKPGRSGPRKGRRMSAAHRLAIKRGIAAKKAAEKKS